MAIKWRRFRAPILIVVFTLALLEFTALLAIKMNFFAPLMKGIEPLELERNPEFLTTAASYADLGPTKNSVRGNMYWASYAMPPIRLSTHKIMIESEPDLLVNKYRRAKLNDDPRDEEKIDPSAFKILLSGNSTGLGLGATKNSTTLAAVLQKTLREKLGPGANVQVLNFCVPDFKFPDELISFVMRWSYIRPDIWLVFNGDNDSTFLNEKLATSIKYLVQRKRFSMYLMQNKYNFLPNFQKAVGLYNFSRTQNGILRDLSSSAEEAFLQTDESLYLENLRSAAALAFGFRSKLVHVMQPIMWNDHHIPTPDEIAHAEVVHAAQGVRIDKVAMRDTGYRKFYKNVRDGITEMRARGELLGDPLVLNYDDVFEPAAGQAVYYDTKHYNDLGNRLIGERLAGSLLPLVRAGLSRKGPVSQ